MNRELQRQAGTACVALHVTHLPQPHAQKVGAAAIGSKLQIKMGDARRLFQKDTVVYRSRVTKEINPELLTLCDPDHPDRLEGHSLHAVVASRRHFILAPAIAQGAVVPCSYVCIWSLAGGLLLSSRDAPHDITCQLFSCYFPSEFAGMQFIMAGVYGSAYRAIWSRSDGSPPLNVVIKRIDLKRTGPQDLILVMREKMLLQRLHHEEISSIIMQYVDPSDSDIVYFVLEDGGPSTLDNLLRDAIHHKVAIMPSNVQIVMTHVSSHPIYALVACLPHTAQAYTCLPSQKSLQILSGLSFLHHNLILHRDIKGDNICVSGFVSRIIDFGMARSLIVDGRKADGDEMLLHQSQTFHETAEEEEDVFITRNVSAAPRTAQQYSAPEVLLSHGHYDSKVDVWALGCLLSELLYCCDASQLVRNGAASSRFTARFIFRPDASTSSLALILRHLVSSPDDLVDAAPGGKTKRLSERALSSLVARGFIDPAHHDGSRMLNPHGFEWTDLSSKFPTPELPAEEIAVFEKLRALMMRMLSFDPDNRLSAAEALKFLTGVDDHPVRVAPNVMEEFRNLEHIMDRTCSDPPQRDICLRFIKHVDPHRPSEPSPLSLLLHQ